MSSYSYFKTSSERKMSPSRSASVTALKIEEHVFPTSVKPPGTTKPFFLGGAGERGLEIQGKFIKFTTIGVYLEDNAVTSLAVKWKGKSADELTESVEFFRDIVSGPFEKFTQVRMILPLTGKQYAEKVTENCVAIWKSMGIYTNAEELAIQKFTEVFETVNFPPGSSILFTQSPLGSLTSNPTPLEEAPRTYVNNSPSPNTALYSSYRNIQELCQISFSQDGVIPEKGSAVIENKQLSESFLQSIIGAHGVSPAAKRSLAVRLSQLFNEFDGEVAPTEAKVEAPVVVSTELSA